MAFTCIIDSKILVFFFFFSSNEMAQQKRIIFTRGTTLPDKASAACFELSGLPSSESIASMRFVGAQLSMVRPKRGSPYF